jgi:hypothetical protein
MEQLYHRIFDVLPIHLVHADEDLHLLTPRELQLVRRTERWSMVAAALIEVVFSLAIFLPIYAFPDFFEGPTLRLGGPFTQSSLEILWLRDLWILVMTVVGLYVLVAFNLAAVHGVAVATGYIRRDNKAEHAPGLIDIALERKFTGQKEFGLDPFEGVHPWVIFAFLALYRLQGLIASGLVKATLSNLFGREILRVYLDFAGLPIYMLINMYTTRVILRTARVVMMGRTAMELALRQVPPLRLSDWEKDLIYDTLQFISVNKRDFHPNHYYLAHAVFEHFAIPVKPNHSLPRNYFDKVKEARQDVAEVCKLLIVLGFLLDGRLTRREHAELDQLRALGILDIGHRDLERYCRDFVNGQGLCDLTRHLLDGTPP